MLKKSIIYIFLFYFCLSASPAAAIVVSVSEPKNTAIAGQSFTAHIFLDTQGETINAIAGTLSIPDFVTVSTVQDGQSIIKTWIAPVKIPKKGNGLINFSGIMPAGFVGQGELFSLTLITSATEKFELTLKDFQAFYNDGRGTPASVNIVNAEFQAVLAPTIPTPSSTLNSIQPDTSPPESFRPQLQQNPYIFDGAWFLIFQTTDRDSGIDHYEIAETTSDSPNKNDWVVAQSPWLLQDQNLKHYIFVKAVDRSGNERVELALIPSSDSPHALAYVIITMIILLIIIGLSLSVYAKVTRQ